MDGRSIVATEAELFQRLHDMYWRAATREVCNMILFFNEVFQAPESVRNILNSRVMMEALEGQNFKKMFDLWKHWTADQSDIRRLCARWILQSSGFLDIDVLHEPATRIFLDDETDEANVEELEIQLQEQSAVKSTVFSQGLICSKCTLLIRSPFFYECTEGCPWMISHPYDILYEDEIRTIKPDHLPQLAKAARRLCSDCVSEDGEGPCRREHLERICYENPPGDNIRMFRRKLSKRPGSRLHNTLTNLTADIRKVLLMDGLGLRADMKRLATPAGSFHVAFMFGPLIIESGIEKTNRGVLISERPLPHLLPDTTTADWFIDSVDEAAPSPKTLHGIVLFKHKIKKTKMLSDFDSNVGGRQILGSVKRVYGAACSGYLEENADKESAVVDAMVSSAASCEWNHSKTVKASHLKLRRSADKVVEYLHQLLDTEIEVHLRRITKRLLDPKATLSWGILRNNCQRLVNTLLKGKDFEYTFPRLPKDFGSRARDAEGQYFGWPRYLISFGDRLDGQHSEGQQSNSIISTFCQRQRHQCDLIDHIELISHRSQDDRKDRVYKSKSWHELRLAPNGSGGTGLTRTQLDNMTFDKLWELPRDTLSVLQFHLLRPTHRYRNCDGRIMDEVEWIDNRLRLTRQLYFFSVFAGGLGAALLDILHREPSLLSRVHIPKSRIFGTIRADEKVKVIHFTSWDTTYFILNRRSPQHSEGSAGPSKFPASLGSFGSAGIHSQLITSITLNYSMNSYLKRLIYQLVRQRLYGKDEWFSLTLPNNTVAMIQILKKDKAVH